MTAPGHFPDVAKDKLNKCGVTDTSVCRASQFYFKEKSFISVNDLTREQVQLGPGPRLLLKWGVVQ